MEFNTERTAKTENLNFAHSRYDVFLEQREEYRQTEDRGQ